ncbi:MAG: peptide-methionine (R)-S-oxide reductase MsrB [Acidobacteriota bacterium]|nr:peptide-methionine (R)-S-oxide reductase MsrB [Acidobacteriota bacterium]
MDRRDFLRSGLIFGGLAAFSGLSLVSVSAATPDDEKLPFKKIVKSDKQWKRILTAEQYRITRQKGTEAPYSSPMNKNYRKGTFTCVCCDLPLFSSKTKFNSNTGWASFYAPVAKINVREAVDKSEAEIRTEVLCNRCDAHLGHVFGDGPKPTGLRYCINGVAMKFVRG